MDLVPTTNNEVLTSAAAANFGHFPGFPLGIL
jgi:hypothetical protein